MGQTEIRITNNTFQALVDLPIKKLKLELNKLLEVEPLGFQWFPLLTDLDMSNSKGLNVMQFLDSAHSTLKQTNLTRLKLTSFKQHYKGGGSQVVYLKREIFQQLPQLSELHLDDTDIINIGFDFLSKLKSIQYLNLAHNFLDDEELFKFFMELEYGKNLHTLDIRYQSKTYQLEGKLPPLVIFLRRNMKRLILSGIDSMKRPSSNHNNRDIIIHRQGGLSYLEYRDNNLEYLSFTIRHPNSTFLWCLTFPAIKLLR